MNGVDKYSRIGELCENADRIRLSRRAFFKSLAILAGSLIFLSQTENAYAHPPSEINIAFNAKTKVLNAVIIHAVSNPTKHFINKVDISLNGQEIIEHKISQQDNNASQTVSYLVPDAKTGDRLSVEAYCNISGKLKREIRVTNR